MSTPATLSPPKDRVFIDSHGHSWLLPINTQARYGVCGAVHNIQHMRKWGLGVRLCRDCFKVARGDSSHTDMPLPILAHKTAKGRIFLLMASSYYQRFDGDTCAGSRFEIWHNDTHVGQMFEGGAYAWNQPHCCMNPLRWSGLITPDHYDANWHDIAPMPSRVAALQEFARRAEIIYEWRSEHRASRLNRDGTPATARKAG